MKKTETRGRKKKPPADKLVPVMTHLPLETVEKLNRLSAWQERPVSQIVRMATNSYLRFVFGMVSGELQPAADAGTIENLGGGYQWDWVQRAREDLGITKEVLAGEAERRRKGAK
jgi:hypothetical protein